MISCVWEISRWIDRGSVQVFGPGVYLCSKLETYTQEFRGLRLYGVIFATAGTIRQSKGAKIALYLGDDHTKSPGWSRLWGWAQELPSTASRAPKPLYPTHAQMGDGRVS